MSLICIIQYTNCELIWKFSFCLSSHRFWCYITPVNTQLSLSWYEQSLIWHLFLCAILDSWCHYSRSILGEVPSYSHIQLYLLYRLDHSHMHIHTCCHRIRCYLSWLYCRYYYHWSWYWWNQVQCLSLGCWAIPKPYTFCPDTQEWYSCYCDSSSHLSKDLCSLLLGKFIWRIAYVPPFFSHG